MIFSLFWEGAFIRRGRLFEGGVYFKIRDFRGRSFERAFIRGGAFIRGNTVFWNHIGWERAHCAPSVSPFFVLQLSPNLA